MRGALWLPEIPTYRHPDMGQHLDNSEWRHIILSLLSGDERFLCESQMDYHDTHRILVEVNDGDGCAEDTQGSTTGTTTQQAPRIERAFDFSGEPVRYSAAGNQNWKFDLADCSYYSHSAARIIPLFVQGGLSCAGLAHRSTSSGHTLVLPFTCGDQ